MGRNICVEDVLEKPGAGKDWASRHAEGYPGAGREKKAGILGGNEHRSRLPSTGIPGGVGDQVCLEDHGERWPRAGRPQQNLELVCREWEALRGL